MSDKKRAVFLFLHYTTPLVPTSSPIPAINALISGGNTHLLALRTATDSDPVSLFKTISGLSYAVDGLERDVD